MEDFGTFLTQYATSEVFTVLAALVTAWIGWKAARKTGGMIKSFAGKASFAGLTSAALLFAGFGGIGLGIGEWASRDSDGTSMPKVVGFSDSNLTKMAKKGNGYDSGSVSEILDYAQERDEKNRRAQLAHDIQTLPPEELEQKVHEWLSVDGSGTIPVSFKPSVPFEIKPADDKPINEESIMSTPVAWLAFCLGIASITTSGVMWTTRSRRLNHIA